MPIKTNVTAKKKIERVEIRALDNCGSCGVSILKGQRALIPVADAEELVNAGEVVYVEAHRI